MRLSLLKPVDESPRTVPQIPTQQVLGSFPTERDIAVDTSALPARNAALIAMDPSVTTAPLDALARLGATGAQVGTDALNIVMQAEARKKEADNLAEATGLYTQTALKFDQEFEKLKTSEDHNTMRPAFDELWNRVVGPAVDNAPNPEVQRSLALKLAGYRLTKSAETSDIVRKKFVDYHEASLIESSKALVQQATDPDATPPDRSLAIANLTSLYQGYAKTGIFPPDRLLALQDRFLTTGIYNTLAQQAMTKDPEAFLPKSEENPAGGGGYRDFMPGGRYPADPKYLNTLLDSTAPRLVEQRRTQQRLQDERTEKNFDKNMAISHQQKFDQLMTDLDSGDPMKVRAAAAEVPQAIQDSGLYWSDAKKDTIRTMARTTRVQGGVTNDAVYNDLYLRAVSQPGSVSEDEVLKWQGLQQLAPTGERSAASLIEKIRGLNKADDTSKRPDYAVGMELIRSGLSGFQILSMGAAFNPNIKMGNIAKHQDLYSKAIQEFDTRSRMPGWSDKNLRDLGAEIRDAYIKLFDPSFVPTPTYPAPRGTP